MSSREPVDQVDAPANDPVDVAELQADLERMRECLKRVRSVAWIAAGMPATVDPLKPLPLGKEAYAVIMRSCDAALEVRAANVVTPLFGRAS